MIDTNQLRDFIKQVIREEVSIDVLHISETYSGHAKIQVALRMDDEEFTFYETYVYE